MQVAGLTRRWVRSTRLLLAAAVAVVSVLGTTEASGSSEAGGPPWCNERGSLDAMAMPEEFSSAVCDVTGRVIIDHEIGVVVPSAGTGVVAEGYGPANTQVFGVQHSPGGRFTLMNRGSEQEELSIRLMTHSGDSSPADPECVDDSQTSLGYHEDDNHNWFVSHANRPSNLTDTQARVAFVNGSNNIEYARNDCYPVRDFGNANLSNIDQTWAGTTSLAPNINSTPSCTSRDDVNVVGWGSMSQYLALHCAWYSALFNELYEADVKFNTNYSWTVDPDNLACIGRYDVESVMTHERGHTFGVGHVSELTHSRMTMSTNIDGSCQAQESWIGLGDFLGLTYN